MRCNRHIVWLLFALVLTWLGWRTELPKETQKKLNVEFSLWQPFRIRSAKLFLLHCVRWYQHICIRSFIIVTKLTWMNFLISMLQYPLWSRYLQRKHLFFCCFVCMYLCWRQRLVSVNGAMHECRCRINDSRDNSSLCAHIISEMMSIEHNSSPCISRYALIRFEEWNGFWR